MKNRRLQQRIGILDFTSPAWTAGSTFTRVMAWSLARACQGKGTELAVLSEDESKLAEYKLPVSFIHVSGALLGVPTEVRPSFARRVAQRVWGRPDPSTSFNAYIAAREAGVSVLLPPGDVPDWTAGVKTLGWIPDFQHLHLPHFFTEQELRNRDRQYRRLAERADAILLSSHVAQIHFSGFAPDLVSKTRVASFPSVFAFEAPSGNSACTRQKYHLPEKFALIANQFWAHKNHDLVVEGLRRLRRKGVRIPVVMTGVPLDHRDPGNRVLSRLLQGIASGGLTDQVVLLGEVTRDELVDLMRTAALIIQPSRFEGWSTVVQDAKALGRPLVCSDIPVHREQAPGALGWFPCDAPDVLADLIASHWDGLNPGPDPVGERKAMLVEQEFAARYGRILLELCRDVVPV